MDSQRKTILILVFLFIASGVLLAQGGALASTQQQPGSAEKDSAKTKMPGKWHGADKYSHFTVSAFLAAGQIFVLREKMDFSENRSLAVALASTALTGIAKEVYDGVSKKGTPSFKDLLADFAGIGLVVAVFKVAK